MTTSSTPLTPSERAVVFLVAAVQFVNILDFVMVMPLGPYFAQDLGIRAAQLGYIGGAYTAAASIAGLLGSLFLDRIDRRTALGFALLGLVMGTAAGALARDLPTLIAARALAGFFGGPATSVAIAIVADAIPPERRGRAMARVMGAFSVAQVVGLPASLFVADHLGWRMSFIFVALVGLLVTGTAVFLLPPQRGHLARRGRAQASYAELLSQPIVRTSYLMTALVMAAGFLIIPNIPGYVTANLHFPVDRLKWLYAIGGLTTVASIPLVGRLVDRYGSFRIGAIGAAMTITVTYTVFWIPQPIFPQLGQAVAWVVAEHEWFLAVFFVAFMTSMAFRNVAYNTLTTKVPAPEQRARFNSLQSSVQHMASAAGAFFSSRLLQSAAPIAAAAQARTAVPLEPLVGMNRVAEFSVGLSALVPLLLWVVETRLKARDAEEAATTTRVAA